MNRDQKTAVVDEIAGQIQSAQAIFAVDYRGISVAQAAELRTRLTEADARFRVVKNSLSERAADQAGVENLKPMLVGPTALAFVSGDAALAAKALSDSARQFRLLDFKGGVMDGSVLSAEDVRSIARLPSRDVLNAQLVATVAAPITGLVRGLNALIAGLAIQLQAIADQGLVTGSPAAPAPGDAAEAAAEETAEAAGVAEEPPTPAEQVKAAAEQVAEAAAEAAPAAAETAPAAAEGAPAAAEGAPAAAEAAPATAEGAPAAAEAEAPAPTSAPTDIADTDQAPSDAAPSDA